MRIGVLEDDLHLQQLYKIWFESVQHTCTCYGTVKEFLEALAANTTTFDLLIIDWMLPDSTGEVALKWIRANIGWGIPVIFVTARDAEVDIVNALRAGADDYLVKPAKFLELLARIEALGRRVKPPSLLQLGAYVVNQDLRQICLHDKEIELTQKEFELASFLFQNHGILFSRVQLLEKVWGLTADVDTRTVDTHISRIRRKLAITAENGWQIVPVYGYGYRFERVDNSPSP
jgi:DNA-binding response OmpR family regulator